MKLAAYLFVLPLTLSGASFTSASLSFDGLKNQEQVLNFYAGGLGGQGSGPGLNQGVTFSAGIAADSTTIAFGSSALVTAPNVTMTLSDPSTDTLSFYFTGSGSISFYSGPNATGSLLQSFELNYPPFFPFAARPGSFESVVFTPALGTLLRIDSVTIGSFLVIPEPSVAILLLIGTFFLTIFRRSRADG